MSSAPARTAPEDKISIPRRLAYGLGAFVNNLLGAASGGMMIVLNLGFGMDPSLVGWLGMLPRLTDAFTDPVMGYISDHTRTRWGRRRPYIFVGAIVTAILFVVLWQLPAGQERDVLLRLLPRGLDLLLHGLHRLGDALGRAGLRTDARLQRAHPADGHAELHRAAGLHRVALVPVDHEFREDIPERGRRTRPGGGGGGPGGRHRAWW